jgi:hypothetical protein
MVVPALTVSMSASLPSRFHVIRDSKSKSYENGEGVLRR